MAEEVFDVRGQWNANQGNGFVASFDLRQNGKELTGSASHSGGKVESRSVEGSVIGNSFLLTVTWNNGSIGEYNGTFNAIGRIVGVTFDVNHPTVHATWFSSEPFQKMTINP